MAQYFIINLVYSTQFCNNITVTIEINYDVNQPPTADFIYEPKIATNETDICFTDLSKDTDGTVVSWWWDFGDGYYSNLQNPMHCFYFEGKYYDSLTITNVDGLTDTAQKMIKIEGDK